MGRYTGIVKSLPSSGKRYGYIYSLDIAGMVPFDAASIKAADGDLVEGSRVSFEQRTSGVAYKIIASKSKNYNALTRHHYVREPPTGGGNG